MRMHHSLTIRILVVLLAIVLILTVVSAVTAPPQLKVDNGSSVGVPAAQSVWAKTYGGEGDDRAFSMLQVGEDFLVVGSTKEINTTMGWALMLNGTGDAVWNRTYLEGAGTEIRYAVNTTRGYLFVGNMFTSTGDQNGYAFEVDSMGTIIWQVTLGGEKTDKFFGGVVLPDGFCLYGLTNSYGNTATAAWVVRLDTSGNLLWDNSYQQGADCALRSGVADDIGLVASGYADATGDGNYDFLLLKIAPNGNIVWNRTYGGVEAEKAYSMTNAADGYVLTGEIESQKTSTDTWVLKVDYQGNPQWARTMGGDLADSPSYITDAKDSGFLICGFTFSFGGGNRDFWLTKLSAEGNVLFSCTYGDGSFQEAYSVIDLGENQYVLAGWTDPVGKPELIGSAKYDFLAVELNAPEESQNPASLWLIAAWVVFGFALAAAVLHWVLLKKGDLKIKPRWPKIKWPKIKWPKKWPFTRW